MGQLRDFFSKIGLCESTADLARKPQLIDNIVDYSLHYADQQTHYEQDSTYEQRLRAVLPCASAYTLDKLIENNVIVCLDQRLGHQNIGFWSTEIRALFYNGDEHKVLSISDRGYLNPGFFGRDIRDRCSSIFNKAAYDIIGKNDTKAIIGGYIAGSKSKYFTWNSRKDFNYEFERNPELREPPLANRDINAPQYYQRPEPPKPPEQGPLGPI